MKMSVGHLLPRGAFGFQLMKSYQLEGWSSTSDNLHGIGLYLWNATPLIFVGSQPFGFCCPSFTPNTSKCEDALGCMVVRSRSELFALVVWGLQHRSNRRGSNQSNSQPIPCRPMARSKNSGKSPPSPRFSWENPLVFRHICPSNEWSADPPGLAPPDPGIVLQQPLEPHGWSQKNAELIGKHGMETIKHRGL